jgi:hypothetical protein
MLGGERVAVRDGEMQRLKLNSKRLSHRHRRQLLPFHILSPPALDSCSR